MMSYTPMYVLSLGWDSERAERDSLMQTTGVDREPVISQLTDFGGKVIKKRSYILSASRIDQIEVEMILYRNNQDTALYIDDQRKAHSLTPDGNMKPIGTWKETPLKIALKQNHVFNPHTGVYYTIE